MSMAQSSRSTQKRVPALTAKRIDAIIERLAQNKPVRRTLPDGGRLHIDRQLPFLCVYRNPKGAEDSSMGRLLFAEAAYALVPGDRPFHKTLTTLLTKIAAIMVERFGAFLLLEIWSPEDAVMSERDHPLRPAFRIHASHKDELSVTVQTLRERLGAIKISKQRAEVMVKTAGRITAPGMRPLFSAGELERLGCFCIGVEVDPIFINPRTETPYPLLFRSLKRQLGRVLDRAFYEFALEHTTHQPLHYYALGRRAMVKAVWDVDRRLAAVSNSFDLLYQVTPVNAEQEWRRFRRNHFEKAPAFLYRPRVIDPGRMKRTLYDIPVERVEDPTLMHLFLDK